MLPEADYTAGVGTGMEPASDILGRESKGRRGGRSGQGGSYTTRWRSEQRAPRILKAGRGRDGERNGRVTSYCGAALGSNDATTRRNLVADSYYHRKPLGAVSHSEGLVGQEDKVQKGPRKKTSDKKGKGERPPTRS